VRRPFVSRYSSSSGSAAPAASPGCCISLLWCYRYELRCVRCCVLVCATACAPLLLFPCSSVCRCVGRCEN
jgi:hypothetical protein